MLHRIGDKNTESDGSRAELRDPGFKHLSALPRKEGRLGGLTQSRSTIFFIF